MDKKRFYVIFLSIIRSFQNVDISKDIEKDFGLWSSTLVSTNSTIFNGAVHVG